MSESTEVPPSIDETDIVIIDVETTGLSPDRGDRVCEIGAVQLRGGAIVRTFSTLINPCRPISAGAFAVNKISPEMVADAPTFPQIVDPFLGVVEGALLGAYNTPFDLGFVNAELRLAGFPSLPNPTIDILPLARQLLPGLGRYPQEAVGRTLGIAAGKHRALDDALVTAQLFIIFASILKSFDLRSIDHLSRKDLGGFLRAKRLEVINESIRDKCDLWVKYHSSADAAVADSIVSPKALLPTYGYRPDQVQLQGFCRTSNAERIFNVDRMLEVKKLG